MIDTEQELERDNRTHMVNPMRTHIHSNNRTPMELRKHKIHTRRNKIAMEPTIRIHTVRATSIDRMTTKY